MIRTCSQPKWFSIQPHRHSIPTSLPPRGLMTKNEKTQASSINDAACRKFKTTTGEFSTSSDNKILIQNPDPNLGIPLDPKFPRIFIEKNNPNPPAELQHTPRCCMVETYLLRHLGLMAPSGLVLVAVFYS